MNKFVRWWVVVGLSLAIAAVTPSISAVQLSPEQVRDLRQSLEDEAKKQLEEAKQLLASGAISKREFKERRAQILQTQNVFNSAFPWDPDRLVTLLQRLIDSPRTGPYLDAILQHWIDQLSPA